MLVRKFNHLLWKASNGQQNIAQHFGTRQVHPQHNNPLAVEMDAAPDRPAQPAGLSPQASCDVDRDPDAVDDHDPARAVEVGFSAGALDRCDYLASAARDVRTRRCFLTCCARRKSSGSTIGGNTAGTRIQVAGALFFVGATS